MKELRLIKKKVVTKDGKEFYNLYVRYNGTDLRIEGHKYSFKNQNGDNVTGNTLGQLLLIAEEE